MAANKNKRKLRAPKVADSELSRVVTDIYDELNKLSGGLSDATEQRIKITTISQSDLPLNPVFQTVTANTFTGNLIGNVTGDVTGSINLNQGKVFIGDANNKAVATTFGIVNEASPSGGGSLAYNNGTFTFTPASVPSLTGYVQTISTSATSGLSSNESSGTVTMSLDVNRLTAETTVTSGDFLALSQSGNTKKVTLANIDLNLLNNNNSGFINDYTVTQADVTQHQAALSITESQISDLQSYLTAHPTIGGNAITQNNSGNSFIQDLTFDGNGHVTAVASATASFTNTNYYLNGANWATGTGVLTLNVQGASDVTVDLDGRYLTALPSHNHNDLYYTESEVDGFLSGKDNYQSWTISDSVSPTPNTEAITSGSTLKFAGSGATTVTYNPSNNIMTISSTDTNTDTNSFVSAGSYNASTKDLTLTITGQTDPVIDLTAIDADKLDGQEGSYYLNYNNLNNLPSLNFDNYDHWTLTVGTDSSDISSNDAVTFIAGTNVTLNKSGTNVTINSSLPSGAIDTITTSNTSGLSSNESSGNVTLNLAIGNLTAITTADSQDSIAILDGSTTKKITLDNIPLSAFNDDSTFLKDADFTSNGFLKRTGNGTYAVDTNTYLTSETSHSDVLVDGDFATAGFMKTNGSGTYSVDGSTYLTSVSSSDVTQHLSVVTQSANAGGELSLVNGEFRFKPAAVSSFIALTDLSAANDTLNTSTSGSLSYSNGTFTFTPPDLSGFLTSLPSHNHNDLYYTETELNAGQLNNLYYTESEVDGFLGNKDNYDHWTISDGTNSGDIDTGATLTVAAGTGITTAYSSSTQTLTIESTLAGGDITAVNTATGSGLSGGASTGAANLQISVLNLTDMTDDVVGGNDELIIRDASVVGNQTRRKAISEIKLSQFNNDAGFVTSTGDNTFVTSASFNTGDGVLTLTRNDSNTVTADLDGRYLELGGGTLTGDLTLGNNSTDRRLRVYYSDNAYTEVRGYGIQFDRASSYIRPTGDNTKDMYFGEINKTWRNISFDATAVQFSKNNVDYLTINSSGDVDISNDLNIDGSFTNTNGNASWRKSGSNYTATWIDDKTVKFVKSSSSYAATTPYAEHQNFIATFSFKTSNATHLGLVYHGQNSPSEDGYNVIIRSSNTVRVQKRQTNVGQSYLIGGVNGTAISGVDIDDGNWHRVTVQVISQKIRVDIDGNQIINGEINDTTFTEGGVGYIAFDGTVEFNNLEVQEIPSTTFIDTLNLNGISEGASNTVALMWDPGKNVTYRTLGSNAFNSDTIPTASDFLPITGGTLTDDLKINLNTNAQGNFVDNIGEVGSGNFCLQVSNSAENALKPLGFRAEKFIFANGNVGIGTDSAEKKLHINDVTQANQAIRFGNPTATPYGEINYDASGFEHLYIRAKGTTTGYGNIVFETGGSLAEAMRIKSSGTILGTGTYTAGNSIKIFEARRSGGAVASDWSYDDATTDMSLGTSTAHRFSLKTSDTNRLTIDSSGTVLVGADSDTGTGAGHVLFANGASYQVRDGGFTALFKRLNSDGEILRFYKDSAQIGSIGSDVSRLSVNSSGNNIFLQVGGSTKMAIDTNGKVYPGTHNANDLGFSTSHAWRDLYLSGDAYIGDALDVGGNVDIDGKLTLDPNSLTNGIINTPASLRINIDSNNNNTGEKFVIGHNQDSINNNNELFVVNESGDVEIAGNVTATNILTVAGAGTGSPFLQFTQGGTQKAYIQYADSGDSFELQSDNQFVVRTGGSTTAFTINNSQHATFSGDVVAPLFETTGTGYLYLGGHVRLNNPGSGTFKIGQYNGSSWNDTLNITNDGNVGITGDVEFSGNTLISTDTSDGSDNAQIIISGGGASGDTRGASIHASGNEHGNGGLLQLRAGSGTVSEIRSYTSGTERMRITSAGDVNFYGVSQNADMVWDRSAKSLGIGETIPTSKLSIKGAQAAIDITRGTSGDSKWGFSSDSTSLYIAELSTGATNYVMAIKDSGNVGIGTTSPTSKVSITDSATMYAAVDGILLDVKRNASNGGETTGRVGLRLANNSNGFNIYYGGTTDRLRFVDGGNTEVLSLKNGGNVGIGATNPAQKLVVNGGIHAYGNITTPASGTHGLLMDYYIADSRFWSRGTTGGGTRGGFKFYQLEADGTNQITSFALDTSGNASFGYDVDISSDLIVDGNVGIGTDSPSSMLNVNTTGTSNFGLKLSRNDSATDGFEFTYTPSSAVAFIDAKYPASSGQVYGDIVFRHNVGGSQTERMRLEADGGNVIIQEKVGIGTDDPKELLHIYQQGTVSNYYDEGALQIGGPSTSYGALLSYHGSSSGRVSLSSLYNTGGANATLSFGFGGINTSGRPTNEVLTVNQAGNVGIGTTLPNAQLEVLSDGSAAVGAEIRLQHANNNSTDVVSTVNFANNAGSVAMIQGGTTGANNTGYISFFTDNAGTSSEKMRILSSGGITFNGDTAAANALDDYEEGTFTPQIHAGASNPSFNSNNYGKYTKIGNVVHCSGRFSVNSITAGSSSTNVELGGLPFAANTPLGTSTGAIAGSIGFATGFAGEAPTMMQIRDGETNAFLYFQNSSLGISNLKGNDFGTGAHSIVFQITYHV